MVLRVPGGVVALVLLCALILNAGVASSAPVRHLAPGQHVHPGYVSESALQPILRLAFRSRYYQQVARYDDGYGRNGWYWTTRQNRLIGVSLALQQDTPWNYSGQWLWFRPTCKGPSLGRSVPYRARYPGINGLSIVIDLRTRRVVAFQPYPRHQVGPALLADGRSMSHVPLTDVNIETGRLLCAGAP